VAERPRARSIERWRRRRRAQGCRSFRGPKLAWYERTKLNRSTQECAVRGPQREETSREKGQREDGRKQWVTAARALGACGAQEESKSRSGPRRIRSTQTASGRTRRLGIGLKIWTGSQIKKCFTASSFSVRGGRARPQHEDQERVPLWLQPALSKH